MKNYIQNEFVFKKSSRELKAKTYTCILGVSYVLFSIPFVIILHYIFQIRHSIKGISVAIALDMILFSLNILGFFGGLFVLHGYDHHFTYAQTKLETWLVNKHKMRTSKVKFVTKNGRKYLLRWQEVTLVSSETELKRNQYLVGAFKIILGLTIIPLQPYASAKQQMMFPFILVYSLILLPLAMVVLYKSKKEDLSWRLLKKEDETGLLTWNNNKKGIKYRGMIGSFKIVQSTYEETFPRKGKKRVKEGTLQVYNLELDLTGKENALNYYLEEKKLLLYSNMQKRETVIFKKMLESWLEW